MGEKHTHTHTLGVLDYFKGLAHAAVEAEWAHPESAGQAGSLETQGGVDVAVVIPKTGLEAAFFLSWENVVF